MKSIKMYLQGLALSMSFTGVLKAAVKETPLQASHKVSQVRIYAKNSNKLHSVQVKDVDGKILFQECFGDGEGNCDAIGDREGYTKMSLYRKSNRQGIDTEPSNAKRVFITGAGAVVGGEIVGSIAFGFATGTPQLIPLYMIGLPVGTLTALTVVPAVLTAAGIVAGSAMILVDPVGAVKGAWQFMRYIPSFINYAADAALETAEYIAREHPGEAILTVAGAIAGGYYAQKYFLKRKKSSALNQFNAFLEGHREEGVDMLVEGSMEDYIAGLKAMLKA